MTDRDDAKDGKRFCVDCEVSWRARSRPDCWCCGAPGVTSEFYTPHLWPRLSEVEIVRAERRRAG